MRADLVTITIVLLSVTSVMAQPDTLWTSTYGDLALDAFYSVVQTQDGGFVAVGETTVDSLANVLLVKKDVDGNNVWVNNYGGRNTEVGYCLYPTSDDGFIIVGESDTPGYGSSDVYLVKVDADGVLEWDQRIGGLYSDKGYSVIQTGDDGYLVAGYTRSFGHANGYKDLWVIRTDSQGDTVWTRTFGEVYDDEAKAIAQLNDGDYVITGSRKNPLVTNNTEDIYLLKIDDNGNTIWEYPIDVPLADEYGRSVCATSDGNFIVSGIYASLGSPPEGMMYLLKMTADSQTIIWDFILDGYQWSAGCDVWETLDGSCIVAGYEVADTNYTDAQGIAVKIDNQGNLEWQQTIGGAGNDYLVSCQQTLDEGYILAGYTASTGAGDFDGWLVRLEPEILEVKDKAVSIPSIIQFDAYPNPFNPETVIRFSLPMNQQVSLEVYDTSGKLITALINGRLNAGNHQFGFNGTDLPSGIYFCRLQTDSYQSTQKLVLVK